MPVNRFNIDTNSPGAATGTIPANTLSVYVVKIGTGTAIFDGTEMTDENPILNLEPLNSGYTYPAFDYDANGSRLIIKYFQ